MTPPSKNATLAPPPTRKRLRTPAITRLYSRGLRVLGVEMQHIQKLALKEKLPAGPARDLTNYVRLLDDLQDLEDRVKAEAKKRLEQMSIEELEARAKEFLKLGKPIVRRK